MKMKIFMRSVEGGGRCGAGAGQVRVCGVGGALTGLLPEGGREQGPRPQGPEAHHPVSTPGPEPR